MMKIALGQSRDLAHHDRRVKLGENRQASITSVSSEGSSPVSLVELKPGGKKSKRQNSFHRTGLGTPNSARRLFRTMFDKNSKKSVSGSAASRRDCYPRSEFSSSTTDQAGSISTAESSFRMDTPVKDPQNTSREFTTGPCSPDRKQPSKSQMPSKRSSLLDSHGENAALADSINFLLSGNSPKFTNISDDAALADSINFLLGGTTTKFSVANDNPCLSDKIDSLLGASSSDLHMSNEIKLNSSLHHRVLKPVPLNPLMAEHAIFVDRSSPHKQEVAAVRRKSLSSGICMVEKSTKSEMDVDISVIAAPLKPPPPPPIGQNEYEPATPCFSPKSPMRTKKVTTTSQSKAPAAAVPVAASPKIDDLRNMTQEAMRQMVQQKSPLFALPEKRSIPAFICIRTGAVAGDLVNTPSSTSEQFQKAQELLLRLENNDFGEGLSALKKQVEELETEVLLSTAQWPTGALQRCDDSEMSSLGADQVSYNGEDSYLDNDESPW